MGGIKVYPITYLDKAGVRVYTMNLTTLPKRLTTRSFSSIGQEMAELLRIQRMCCGGGVGGGGFQART